MEEFLASVEIRWFANGKIPGLLKDWFIASPVATGPDQRTDKYLIFPHSTQTGTKIREGRLEIKSRVARLGALEAHGRDWGNLESWEKWSSVIFNLPSPEPLGISGNRNWVEVEKKRWLKLFGWENNKLQWRDSFSISSSGGHFEMAEIKLSNQEYHSFNLEAWGDQPQVLIGACFKEVTAKLISNQNIWEAFVQTASSLNAKSYPQWLKENC